MKKKTLIICLASVVLLGAYGFSLAPNFRHRSERKRALEALRNLSPRLTAAGQALTRELRAGGKPVPVAVPLASAIRARLPAGAPTVHRPEVTTS
jgi:type II secretory pathway component PulM